MSPAVYETYYKKFEKSLVGKDVLNIDNVRRLSKLFALSLRSQNDVYTRKYHAYLFTRWCDTHATPYPIDWNPEGFWDLQFN